MGFAWEFPNGLEVGQLVRNGKIDKDLFNALFYRKPLPNNEMVGAYRLYFPVETFDKRDKYLKLKTIEVQNTIIEELSKIQIPEIAFGVVIPPDADQKTFDTIKSDYSQIKNVVRKKSKGKTRVRCGIFHLMPISTFRSMKTKYSLESYPELWNFYLPAYDGQNFTAKELFEKRMETTKEVDPENYFAMMNGTYGYG
jgi:hypothetical protein